MKRPLLKIYIAIAAAFVLTLLFVPGIISRTSSAAVFAVTQADLIIYNAKLKDNPAVIDKNKAHAVIVMDDGWETQYKQGYEILSQYGMKGCIAVVPARVDTQGYMSYTQLAEVYMDGWDLLNHTYDHTILSTLTKEEQEKQLVSARDWMYKHNFYCGAEIVIYPDGGFCEETKEILKENGFRAGRSQRSVWDAKTGCYREDIEVCNLISSMEFKEAKEAIEKAVSSGNTCILMLHKIEPVTDDTQMQIEPDMLEQIVKYLYQNNDKISVVTMTQLFSS